MSHLSVKHIANAPFVLSALPEPRRPRNGHNGDGMQSRLRHGHNPNATASRRSTALGNRVGFAESSGVELKDAKCWGRIRSLDSPAK
jgi:hypothetical protein